MPVRAFHLHAHPGRIDVKGAAPLLMSNPLRIEGPDPPCTCADVRRWLVAAFMTLPSILIDSARVGEGIMLNPHAAPGTLDWVAFSSMVLGRESRARKYLLTWARCEARRIAIARNMPNPPGGGTVADYCREMGVERRTFDRTVERTCNLLTAFWNERVPK